MPTYDYKCKKCSYEFENFQSMSAAVLRKCPKCSKLSLKRLIGIGSGIIFKGSGFYATDYKKKQPPVEKGKSEEANKTCSPSPSNCSNCKNNPSQK